MNPPSHLRDHQNGISVRSVSRLTQEIKQLLEDKFSIVWISGEVANLKIAASGHAYFTLKDSKAQISAVMFKGPGRNLRFSLKDGLSIVGMGRISVYEPRGGYQLILEYAELLGVGALQIAFEHLKQKLATEGLFDASAKTPIPYFPRTIGLITSPTGAVIHDMLTIIFRRYPNTTIEIMPVRVQGNGAENEIAQALALANRHRKSEVLIVARGGGSFEDLAPFNSELVARAIFASQIPVISAIGHETDFTIADFVADMRAPTPSAAAELVIPLKNDLVSRVFESRQRCCQVIFQHTRSYRRELSLVRRGLVHPKKKIEELHFRSDDFTRRLLSTTRNILEIKKRHYQALVAKLIQVLPKREIDRSRALTEKAIAALKNSMQRALLDHIEKSNLLRAKLELMNPKQLLKIGYSITRKLPTHDVVMNCADVVTDQELEIILHQGQLRAVVKRCES